jgi:uncharacterized protein involved in type VI secretion and phage assembly
MLPAPVDGSAPGYFGVYPAFVTDLVDPDALGRIEVRFPFLGTDGDRDVRAWATLCTPYADADSGLQILPDVDSQVVVAFEAGNLRRPYIVGCAWNGSAALPQDPEKPNDIRLLRSRANSRLEFDDDETAPKITLRTRSGHEVVIDESGAGEITITHALGCVIRLTATDVEIEANLELKVTAPMVEVSAPISTFSGVVKAQTVVADSFVISPAYTPGVGNIW